MKPSLLSDVLRSPETVLRTCHDDDGAQIAPTTLGAIVIAGAAFGAALGLRTSGLQMALSAIKLPLATLLTLSLAGPLLYVTAAVAGRRWRLRTVLAVMLTAGARGSLVLFAATPALLLLVMFGAGYPVVKLAAVAAYALSGRSALTVLLKSLGPAPGRLLAMVTFVGLYLIAGAQSAWVLRPYLGRPGLAPVPVLDTSRQGVTTAVWEAAREAWSGVQR